LHWYGEQKLTANQSNQHKKKQNTIIYYLHTHAHKRNTNTRSTQAQCNYTNTKLKPGLGASYTIWAGNGVGLFYTPDPHGAGSKSSR